MTFTTTSTHIAGLADKVLSAIEANGHMAASWIEDKRTEIGESPKP